MGAMDAHLLNNTIVVLLFSTGALLLCHRIGLPPVLGYLAAGAVIGPHGAGLVAESADVESLAEVGVILLLYAIGLEFSLSSLASAKRLFLVGGSLQMLFAGVAAAAVCRTLGLPVREALFAGGLAALSSTAIVLKLLQERDRIAAPDGRAALAVLIFQDLAAVPMMLAAPLFGKGGGSPAQLLWPLLKSAAALVPVALAAFYLVPALLDRVARTRSRELFILVVVALGLSVAALTSALGLSLALGAFLAGLVVSESKFRHQALGLVVPFRDVFASFFFVSVGMLFDTHAFLASARTILLLSAALILAKAVTATVALRLAGVHPRPAALAGVALAQVGEFSLILAAIGGQVGAISLESRQIFLAVAVLTMIATPALVAVAPRCFGPRRGAAGESAAEPDGGEPDLRDHLVIVGYGLCGRSVARAARHVGIPYRVIEMNSETVRRERVTEPEMIFGDAADPTVLRHAGVEHARALVIAISDNAAVRPAIVAARQINDRLRILARARYHLDDALLRDLGADEVITEEFETSIAIFARVLSAYLVPEGEVRRLVDGERAEAGAAPSIAAADSAARPDFGDLALHLGDHDIAAVPVPEGSPLAGATPAGADLRAARGVTLLAVRRGETTLPNPPADFRLGAGDTLIALGPPERLAAFATWAGNIQR